MIKIPTLFRFSLYGFLKNQQYYDPFIILAFREKGLSFFMIGVLVAFRDAFVNILEIPSGALADLYGRRVSMIMSFVFYIISFAIFGYSTQTYLLFIAMFFFAIGEAFRTGTHKAMIFTWLRNQNRLQERTKIYGYTRSWSKIGSAVSVVIATGLVFYTGKYSTIFYLCIIPYILNVINFLGYPKDVDIESKKNASVRVIFVHLLESFKMIIHKKDLRRLLIEDVGFEGTYKSVKDYLQPVIKSATLALPVFLYLDTGKRSAILIGLVYFTLHIFSGVASRKAHKIVDFTKSEETASVWLWRINLFAFLILTPLLFFGFYLTGAIIFILLAILQNFWRPLIITRIDAYSKEEQGATILSIESQSRTFFKMIMAPILGFVVDVWGFGPVGVFGILISVLIMITGNKNDNKETL